MHPKKNVTFVCKMGLQYTGGEWRYFTYKSDVFSRKIDHSINKNSSRERFWLTWKLTIQKEIYSWWIIHHLVTTFAMWFFVTSCRHFLLIEWEKSPCKVITTTFITVMSYTVLKCDFTILCQGIASTSSLVIFITFIRVIDKSYFLISVQMPTNL